MVRSAATLVAAMPLLLRAQQTLPPRSGANQTLAGTTISVLVAGRSMDEAFTFTLGSQQVVYAAGSWTGFSYEYPKAFAQSVPRGMAYAVTQNAGPRTCRLSNQTGTATGSTLVVFADCKDVPSTFGVVVRVSGTSDGETVSFGMDGADPVDVTAPARQGGFTRTLDAASTVRVWRAGSPAGRSCAITASEPLAL